MPCVKPPRVVAFPPFAALVREIAALRRATSEGFDAIDDEHSLATAAVDTSEWVRASCGRRIVAGTTVLVRIRPVIRVINDGRQSRSRHVPAPENRDFAREPDQVRRFDDFMPHEPIVGPRLVVRDDQHDIGRRWRIISRSSRMCAAAGHQHQTNYRQRCHAQPRNAICQHLTTLSLFTRLFPFGCTKQCSRLRLSPIVTTSLPPSV